MTISSKDRETTLLPGATAVTTKLSTVRSYALKPLCPKRMAEADAADAEVIALTDEISRLMRRPPRHAEERPARPNSNRPSVCRRKPRKVPQ